MNNFKFEDAINFLPKDIRLELMKRFINENGHVSIKSVQVFCRLLEETSLGIKIDTNYKKKVMSLGKYVSTVMFTRNEIKEKGTYKYIGTLKNIDYFEKVK